MHARHDGVVVVLDWWDRGAWHDAWMSSRGQQLVGDRLRKTPEAAQSKLMAFIVRTHLPNKVVTELGFYY